MSRTPRGRRYGKVCRASAVAFSFFPDYNAAQTSFRLVYRNFLPLLLLSPIRNQSFGLERYTDDRRRVFFSRLLGHDAAMTDPLAAMFGAELIQADPKATVVVVK